MSLSLAMIVKNEDFVIGNCLASVCDLVDEMVIVDTGSTDLTKPIAKSYGAKVIDFEWVNDFSIARNESIKHCSSDWILVLDADETLSPTDHDKVIKAINSDRYAYDITIRNYLPHGDMLVMGRDPVKNTSHYSEGNGYSYYAEHTGVRLFRKLSDTMYSGIVHEVVDHFFINKGLAIDSLPDVVIHHYGKILLNREVAKQTIYLDMAIAEAKLHPEIPMSWFNVFQQALVAREPNIALNAASKFLELQPEAPIFIYTGSGIALKDMGRLEDALVCFDAVLENVPNDKIALKYKELVSKEIASKPQQK